MNPVLVISIVAIAISLTALGVSIGAHMAARDCRRVTVMFMTTVMEYLDGDSQVGVCLKKSLVPLVLMVVIKNQMIGW